jgi:hypothetical protein
MRAMRKTSIVLLCIAVATTYGVLHDQITARLCVEYFTIAHPPLFRTTSPTVLGICWGVAATFWVGAVLGLLLALVSQSEGQPPVPIGRLFRSVLGLVAVSAVFATLAGVVGFQLSQSGRVCIPAEFSDVVRPSHHHRFMAVWFAHGASYLVGMAGGALVIFRVWRERGKPRVLSLYPRSKAAILRALLLAAMVALILWFRFIRS